jgi:hypothetical protein
MGVLLSRIYSKTGIKELNLSETTDKGKLQRHGHFAAANRDQGRTCAASAA